MKTKIVLMVLAVATVVLLNSFVDVVAHPTLSADIAVSQLQNDEGAAIAMRSYDAFYNALPLFSWGAATLFCVFLFRSELTKAVKAGYYDDPC